MRIAIDLFFVFAISFMFGLVSWNIHKTYDLEEIIKQNAHAIELLEKQAATP